MTGRIAQPMTLLLIVALTAGCRAPQGEAPADAGAVDGWRPAWIEDPPPLPPGLKSGPHAGTTPSEIELRWSSGGPGFAYSMRNDVEIKAAEGQAGSISTQATGSVVLSPVEAGKWEMTISSSLGSGLGGGPSITKTHMVDGTGRLLHPDPFVQLSLDLMMPLSTTPLVPGKSVTTEVSVPDPSSGAVTKGRTTMGIVDFVSVDGHECAVVALDHEAATWAAKAPGLDPEPTGSKRHLWLLGWFDYARGLYLAISIQESSTTVGARGTRTTERKATYVLNPP